MPRSTDPPPQSLVMASLLLLTTVTALVQSLGAPLVPTIAREHGVSLSTAQWTLTVTLIVGAVTTPLVGRLGGGRRQKRVILVGIGIVTLGCLLAALSVGFEMLVVGRALQGVGIGLTPLAIAAARESIVPQRAPAAIAVLSVSTVAGAGLGYPISGFVAGRFGLPADYWTGVALGLLTLLLVWRFVPASSSRVRSRVDWIGAPLLGVGTVAALLALSQGKIWGWNSPGIMGLAVVSVLAGLLWTHWTLNAEHPLVNLRLGFGPGAIGANISGVLLGVGMYVLLTEVILLAQAPPGPGRGLGHSATVAGFMLLPYSVMAVIGSRALPRVASHVGADAVLPIGSVVFALALVLLIFHRDEVWQLLAIMALGGAGSGLSFAAMPGLIVRVVPPTETGSALAFNHVLRYLGFSLGSALTLATMDHFRSAGVMSAAGFTAGAALGASVCLVAALVSHVVGRRGRGRFAS